MTPMLVWPVLAIALFAQTAAMVTVAELDEEPERWDGRVVTIRGEVVGDYSIRPEHVWIQVNDDPYVDAPLVEGGPLEGGNLGIGVRMPPDIDVAGWGRPGGDEFRGPVVEVTGVFLYNEPSTGGDTFVDASDVVVLEAARMFEAPGASTLHLALGTAMTAGAIVIFAVARRRRLNPAAKPSTQRRERRGRPGG